MKKYFLFAFLALLFLAANDWAYLCVAAEDTAVLARVNGEVITEDALQDRLKAVHSQKSGMPSEGGAGSIEISQVVAAMIDERLMIQEARRVELDKNRDFGRRVESFVATQSILRLRKEEVLDRISVSEEGILEYFKEQYGNDGKVDQERFLRAKGRIERKLKKKQEKELSDGFVSQLKEKADIWIDREVVEQFDLENDYAGTKTAIGLVNSEPVLLNDFSHDVKQAVKKQPKRSRALGGKGKRGEKLDALKKDILERLVTYKLIEQEAVGRNYMQTPYFVAMVEKRKEALLVDAFKAKLVYPLAIPKEKELTQYYDEHIDEFKEEYEVWIREMRFQDRTEAEKILRELGQGASFEFLETQVSEALVARREKVWLRVDRFPPTVRKAVGGLKIGEFSDVIAHGRKFKIIKLKGKRGGKPIEFSKIVERVRRVVVRKRFQEVLSEYMARLRKASKIKIHEKALKKIEERYWKALPEEIQ